MEEKIGKIIFVVIVLGIILYAFNSNILGKLTGSLSSFSPNLPNGASIQNPLLPKGSVIMPAGTSTKTEPIISKATTSINPADIPTGYTEAQLSPFFHKIRFGSLSAGSVYSYGTISLQNSSNETSSIDVTGWQIKSNRGGEYIAQAVNLYDPSGLTPAGDIILKKGHVLNIYSNNAPFNLRLNKCIGYIGNVNKFTPALPRNCPYVNQSDISTFTGVCQQYIYSLGTCSFPNTNSVSIPQTDYACRAYLDTLNYGGCFKKHVNDADFLSNEWRVWAGSNVIDSVHDIVLLLDRNGLLVDYRKY